MRSCRTMPERWNARGEWSHRWHALFCPECRAARRADRKLTRGARALCREPLPPRLEARLLDSLGLPPPVQAPMPVNFGSERNTFCGSRARRLVPVGTAASLLILGLLLARWHDGRRQSTAMLAQSPSQALSPAPRGEKFPPAATRVDSGKDFAGVRTSVRQMPFAGSRLSSDADPGLQPTTHDLTHRRRRLPASRTVAGDLAYLNAGTPVPPSRWVPLSPNEWEAIEASVRRQVRVRDDFITVPFPRLASASDRQVAAAVDRYRREAAIVDARLAREVSLGFKAIALADLCDRLRTYTSIHLAAGPSVIDEKVTLFCEKQPLRDVMRQLSRPFGYTWLRSGTPGAYRYELVQDLKSQLVEEELRNRDRHEALLALEKDLERFQPYLALSPDEALARSKTAAPGERRLLEQLAGEGWGALHLYHQLTAPELAALRAGQEIRYVDPLRPGEQSRPAYLTGGDLPPEIGRGVLQSLRWRRLIQGEGGWEYTPETDLPGVLPPAAIPEARAQVRLRLDQSDLGQFTIQGAAGIFTIGKDGGLHWYGSSDATVGAGTSPTARKPDNARANAGLSGDPALRIRVSVEPAVDRSGAAVRRDSGARSASGERPMLAAPRVTTADVLEALHRASGMPVIADFYTRLYDPEAVSIRNGTLFDTLNRFCDTMRMRWHREDGWLQFRSTTYYDDRLKEVPNRLLARWSVTRRQRSELSLDDLCEIAGLTDAQLDAQEMAEGARELWGLEEWELARSEMARPHLRYAASLTPEQRRLAMSSEGLPFTKMTLAQQQQFIARGVIGDPLQSLEELEGAAFRIDYTQPGWFQWGAPGWSGYATRWVIPLGPGREGRRTLRPSVRERTREAALADVHRIDQPLRQALLEAVRRIDPRIPPDLERFDAEQIFPTRLDLTFVYVPGATNARAIFMLVAGSRSSGYDNSGVARGG
jgi:hypothetical protein